MSRALLAFLAVVLLGPSWIGAEELEVLARVNGEPVTRAERRRIMADSAVRQQLQQTLDVQAPKDENLEDPVLRLLIKRRLILQEARRRHLTVTDAELDQAVTDVRRRFKDLKEFGAWMSERGLNDRSLFDAIRSDLLVTRVRTALVASVGVSEDHVRAYYQARKHGLRISDTVRLRIMVVKDRAEAADVQVALQSGHDFEQLVRERAAAARAGHGREVGWVNLQKLPPSLQEAVRHLKVGETAGPIRSGADFLIVRLEEWGPSRAMTLAEARPEIERRLVVFRQHDALREWLAQQEQQSTIEVLRPATAP